MFIFFSFTLTKFAGEIRVTNTPIIRASNRVVRITHSGTVIDACSTIESRVAGRTFALEVVVDRRLQN